MKSECLKKYRVIGIIFIFVGVAFVPTIIAQVPKLTIESKLIEITTEICGIDSFKPYKAQLNKEEAEELYRLFDSIKERLDKIETLKEPIAIFIEAIVSLNGYGLFPYDISIEQILSLIVFNKDYLIAGNTTKTYFFKAFSGYPYFSGRLLRLIFTILGIELGELITFGYTTRGAYAHMYSSEGWIYIDGPNGDKNLTGKLYGRIRTYFGDNYYHVGVRGYKGIEIQSGDYCYFMGSATQVDIGSERL